MNLQRFSVAISLFVFATTLLAQTSDDCAKLQADKGYPSYYCDCKEGYTDFILPIDTIVDGEPIWYKGWISDLYDGVSAYMHSDCDFKFEVYTSCSAQTPKYSALFAQNQANSIDGEAIKRKLQENNVGDIDMAFYIRISPVAGNGGRLIMRKQNDGMPSTCDDPLYIFPGMSLYTTQPQDVYIVDPNELNVLTDIILEWESNDNIPCDLHITQDQCDGPIIAQTTLHANDIYILPAEQVGQAKAKNQNIYFHLNHAANTAGKFHCLAPEYEEYYIDTLMCQGMGLQLNDTLLTEPTVYAVDTVHTYANVYTINFYDLSFYEPEPQPDTLGLKSTQLPYLYRSQHTITEPGNYDITIHTLGQCDERYLLHVYLDVDTIVHETDTLMCYGGIFEYKGNKYTRNTTFEETSWYNPDTLLINKLHLYFATTPDIVHDTIMQYQRKYNKFFSTIGDVHFLYANPETHCTDSIIMHVIPSAESEVKYDYFYEDYTLCQGMTFTHPYFSGEYTSSTVLVDSFQVASKRWEITVVTVTFTAPEIVPDTLSLKTTELPYLYKEQYLVEDFGEHDVLITAPNTCDEHYQLLVLHNIDTLVYETDTLLCYGKVFVQDSIEYLVDTTLQTVSWLNADTLQIDVLNLYFATLPDEIYETILLEPSELPYQYRDTIITAFGEYELLLYNEEGCQELVYLSVVEKKTTTDVDNTSIYDRPRLIMRGGVVYVLRGSEMFTLLGEKL